MRVIRGPGQGPVEEAIAVSVNAESVAVKEEQEAAAGFLAGVGDTFAEGDFQPDVLGLVKLAVGAGAGGTVQPPGFAVGKDAPFRPASGGLPEPAQIVLHLAAGGAGAGAPV